MKISEIWDELENDRSFTQGVLLRRYSSTVLPDVFVALRSPERFRCIAAVVSNSIIINLTTFSNLKDINVELIPDENKADKNILLFKLLNNQHHDVFSVLCEDLMVNIAPITNEARLVKELLIRFEKWKSLFDKAGSDGLTLEEQRGLFGELFFIRKYLQNNSDFFAIINSWVGCEKQIRDFQSGTWSIEVKTTHGNNHQKIQISSERQLDTSDLENLFLYHLSIEIRQQSGETLNQIVDSVLAILDSDYISLNRFKNKLIEGGYFAQHRNLYESKGYFIREDIFYKVENDFPRIEEKDLRPGLGDVKYSIIVSGYADYIRTEEQVFQTIIPL